MRMEGCSLYFPLSRRRISLLIAATVSTLVLLVTWHNRQIVGRVLPSAFYRPGEPPCRQLPVAEDVLVIMKTGANEVEDKLTVHLDTTLTCYTHKVMFSDYEEDFGPFHLHDAFRYTSPFIKESHEDFALWRQLQAEGRAGIAAADLSGTDSREKPEDIRKQIPGWQLDKWKFLPMVNQTLHMYPNKHWYVFVEADTYLLWSNLLLYVAEKTWTDDHYIGSRAGIEDVGFAHGGSGFLLSRPALKKVVDEFNSRQEYWETYTDRYWVGDHILAAALREAGVFLEDGAPAWHGGPLSLLDLRPEGDAWCSPALTFHHQSPTEIKDLWNFEQTLILDMAGHPSTKLRQHRDLLEEYIRPRIQRPISNWDNNAKFLAKLDAKSVGHCEDICQANSSCMQYAYHDDGDCRITSDVVFGDVSEGATSGWMLARIRKLLDEENC